MRSTALRLTGTLSVCLFALLFTGCGSNNTGKIVGKWKAVSFSKKNEDMEKMKQMGVAMAFEFKADGTFGMEFAPDDDKPGSAAMAKLASTGLQGKETTGKYTLGMGDRVTFSGAKDILQGKKAASDISVNGDNMTWKDGDGSTMQLTRIK